ncbi:hypothetical protein [Marinifilum caeruleilacunae]|uniref:Uncharacterized protein n=1 Tax=Marinifilum caeruleilacunae TaxID=2499076 RepID=A0ABX1WU40_9BACT|nr:hypothetical protein [Marinifilum caeruleilacunae]NOU59621.1 hypothetical protein [Marinifilum caeruleilacunae]
MNYSHLQKNALVIIIFLLPTCFSCRDDRRSSQIKILLADTLNLSLQDQVVEIDSLNSGITRNLRETKEMQDSIWIHFNESFDSVPVVLIHNNTDLYQDTLYTDRSIGLASVAKFKRDSINNIFDLRINKKRYKFKESNSYNFIHIYNTQNDFEIIYTNKGYIYE